MTGAQYEASLRKLNLVVYLLGERLECPFDDPFVRPSLNAVKLTHDLALDPAHKDLMCATSHLSGERINCFTHVHRSVDDLVKKSLMARLLGSLSGCCFQQGNGRGAPPPSS
jgi:4-hydroxybutyryl-CoA dehydratase / vinylacetyl-CoA-Delta-isomerase